MARKAKLKKDQAVTVGGWVMFLTRDEYLFRGKPVVDVRDGETTKTRVPVADVVPYTIEKPITNSILRGTSEPELGVAVQTAAASVYAENTNTASSVPSLSLGKYDRQIINGVGQSIVIDVYDVLDAFAVNDAAVAHAVKKLLAPGQRGNKSVIQDLKEAIQSVERAIERETNKHLRG